MALVIFLLPLAPRAGAADPGERHLLYVVAPGVRNDLRLGGAGILLFDIDNHHAFVKRLSTAASREPAPDNIKGVCASAVTGRLWFTTPKKLYAFDLLTEKDLWNVALPQGCDRLSTLPDGRTLYVPSFEHGIWNVVNGDDGAVLATIETNSGAHNTVVSRDGSRMYLAGLKSPILRVADTRTHKLIQEVGPFSAPIRPFTTNAAGDRCYVCVNDLLGFEVGDLTTGQKLFRVEVAGFEKGPVARHGCPSHGIGLTPDEKELWLCDAHNRKLHIFDNTTTPPTQTQSIPLRDEPGWITFTTDGRYAYPSTGEVIDTRSKKIITALQDEQSREVHSEKMLEIVLRDGHVIATGDQFGIGRANEKKIDPHPTVETDEQR